MHYRKIIIDLDELSDVLCGILALWSENGGYDINLFDNLLHILDHRGPDESWRMKWNNLYLGFTRLKIMDINESFEKIQSGFKDINVLLNGEIWNFKELAKEINIDKEISEYDLIYNLYLKYGETFITLLDGMYSILIFDKNKDLIYIYRDKIGIKPIFYYFNQNNRDIIVASDIKTICCSQLYSPVINEKYLKNQNIFGFSDYEDNFFKDIKQIPPSHYIKINISDTPIDFKLKKYQIELTDDFLKKGQPYNRFQLNILENALKKRYNHTEQYPIGLMLSGGIDSSLLLFLVNSLKLEKIVCFFLGDDKNPDYKWAKKGANSVNYKIINLNPKIQDIIEDLPQICFKLSGIKAFASYFISKKVKELFPEIKILICGEGSDELYGGYKIYLSAKEYFEEVAKKIRRSDIKTDLMEKFSKTMVKIKSEDNYLDEMLNFWCREQLVNNHLTVFDFGTMANSIETRVPYLDLMNLNFISKLPLDKKILNSKRKVILKEILKEKSKIQDISFYERPKNTMPHSLKDSFLKIRQLINHLIPLEWKLDHPYRKYFPNEFDLFWFDLTYYIFIQEKGKIPQNFTIYDLYNKIEYYH